ncbi:hypothetical protein [Nonomuraea sp. NPDC003754]
MESMYGGERPAARADRSLDHRLLSTLAGALGERVTVAGLVAGVRVLLGQDDGAGRLTAEEHDHIAAELFSDTYLEQAHQALARIESYLHPLRELGAGRPARADGVALTCVALEEAGRNPGGELLTDLIVQWLTHYVGAAGAHPPAVIVVGADELSRAHLERLSDACERRRVPLTVLFRHLRESSLQLVGGGAVAFMRLGNHQEAVQAADFIGRRHTFVLSGMTRTVGGSQTHTATDTFGQSATRGTSTSRGHTESSTGNGTPFGGIVSLSRGFSSSTGTSQSTTRNWSSARAFADGASWSDASSTQRVYEYAVEPTALQHLPDYAVLLAEVAAGQGVRVTPADCNPAIVTLPRVSTEPLPVTT